MSGLCAGRVCVVTGAAHGIGRAHVDTLRAAGAHVVVNDIDAAAVDEAVAEVRKAGGSAEGHVGDMSTAAGADELLATALDAWGRLDVVVNNAGIARDRMLVNLTEDDWDAVLDVHLRSTFLVTQRAGRHWRERAKAGDTVDARVVNTAAAPNADVQGDIPPR